MPVLLVLVIVAVPLAELATAIQVGQRIGVGPTLLALVATSILGAALLRRESRRAWAELRTARQQQRTPADPVIRGALVVVGGVLLLAPGFLTDVLGLVLLVTPSRVLAARLLRARLAAATGVDGRGARRGGARRRPDDPAGVLDVEVLDVRRDQPQPLPDPDIDDDPRA